MIEKKVVSQCVSADYCRGWNDAVDAIPSWIPVEEMMPEKMKIVLVFKRRTAHFIWSDAMWNIETDWCGEDGWSKNPHNGCFAVTHWMPLPEPPEEAKTNG